MKPCEIDQVMQKVDEATNKKRAHQEKIREARATKVLSTRGLE
jgi:hypothetical protein